MWRGAPSARCGALAHMPAAVASLNPVWHAALPRLTRGAATTPTRRSSAASSSHVVGQSTTLTSSSGRFLGSSGALLAQMQRQRGQRRTVQLRSVGLPVLAMVNVELSPATYLGVVLIGSGLTLLQIRQSKPVLSRDTDIISACISILAGGILIFQGWRLDPILLFEQLLMASCAIAFGYEALKLRSELPPDQQPDGTFRPVGDGYDFNAPPASPGGLVGQVSPAAGNGQETGQGAVRGGSPADQQQQGQRSAGPGQRGGRGFRGNGQSYGVEDWE